MHFDYLETPYHTHRHSVFAKKGMVATSHPLASQAGLEIMQKGGNAIDAAIATAAALTVVEPTSNGIGGDAFALVWTKGELHGLNASGPAPAAISVEAMKEKGFDAMPSHGVHPITVPGAPSAWAALSKKFGKLPLEEVLAPAIRYAEEGYAVTPVLGKYWNLAYNRFLQTFKEDVYQSWFDTFAPNGSAPKIGEVWKSSGHASTLRSIARTGAESFYRGELADKMVAYIQAHDGFLSKEDLTNYQPEWVTPVSTDYRGYRVWEIPPNGQGIVALMALNIAKGFSFSEKESVDTYHKQIEAMKLAFTDGKAYITDLAHMKMEVERLLSDDYADKRRKQVTDEAITPEAYDPPKGGTVYLAAADEEGNMVSYIQSNYMGFGSGVVIPGTGISMQNRGHDFSFDNTHPNVLRPGKKTIHTIIPGFLTKDNEAVGPFGVMGGYMQPQGHMQVVMNTIDFGLHPQAALDAPRWQWMRDKKVLVEPNFPSHIVGALSRKGHDISIANDGGPFGRGQIIWRDRNTGVLIGGTESRADGTIAAW